MSPVKFTSGAIAGFLPNFLSRFRRDSHSILRIPPDVLVDNVLVELAVEDILCLRRVNKAFYFLTHEPVIWKRLLWRIPVNLPPIRPTYRYALQATDFEVEQLVTRGLSLEVNWRQAEPQIKSSMKFPVHYKILDMKLVPGGRYLIASVKDEYRYFVIVYGLDHPDGPKPLARFPTQTKAYSLQAKYALFKGEEVLMIAFVRRTWDGVGPPGLDISDYGYQHPIDAPFPIIHEMLCVKINLDMLEMLSNREPMFDALETSQMAFKDSQKGPFCYVASTTAKLPIEHLTIYENEDRKSFLAIVQNPQFVVIVDCTTGVITSIMCQEHEVVNGHNHEITALRYVEGQCQFLVCRRIEVGTALDADQGKETIKHLHVVEFYDEPILDGRMVVTGPANFQQIGDDNLPEIRRVHISDYRRPAKPPNTPRIEDPPPPPISVWMETKNRSGVYNYCLWAEPLGVDRNRQVMVYSYRLKNTTFQTRHVTDPYAAHVVPGALRSIIFKTRQDDRRDAPSLCWIRRYINPEFQQKMYNYPRHDLNSGVELGAVRSRMPKMPFKIYSTVPMEPDTLKPYKEGGLVAIAWDEGVGRLCLAAAGTSEIEILDFSEIHYPQQKFRLWSDMQNSTGGDHSGRDILHSH